MFDVPKMLTMAVYSLLLSIISQRYISNTFEGDTLVSLLEKDYVTVPVPVPTPAPAPTHTEIEIEIENATVYTEETNTTQEIYEEHSQEPSHTITIEDEVEGEKVVVVIPEEEEKGGEEEDDPIIIILDNTTTEDTPEKPEVEPVEEPEKPKEPEIKEKEKEKEPEEPKEEEQEKSTPGGVPPEVPEEPEKKPEIKPEEPKEEEKPEEPKEPEKPEEPKEEEDTPGGVPPEVPEKPEEPEKKPEIKPEEPKEEEETPGGAPSEVPEKPEEPKEEKPEEPKKPEIKPEEEPKEPIFKEKYAEFKINVLDPISEKISTYVSPVLVITIFVFAVAALTTEHEDIDGAQDPQTPEKEVEGDLTDDRNRDTKVIDAERKNTLEKYWEDAFDRMKQSKETPMNQPEETPMKQESEETPMDQPEEMPMKQESEETPMDQLEETPMDQNSDESEDTDESDEEDNSDEGLEIEEEADKSNDSDEEKPTEKVDTENHSSPLSESKLSQRTQDPSIIGSSIYGTTDGGQGDSNEQGPEYMEANIQGANESDPVETSDDDPDDIEVVFKKQEEPEPEIVEKPKYSLFSSITGRISKSVMKTPEEPQADEDTEHSFFKKSKRSTALAELKGIVDEIEKTLVEKRKEMYKSRSIVPDIGYIEGRFEKQEGADEGSLTPQGAALKKVKATTLIDDLKKIADFKVQNLCDNKDLESIESEDIDFDTITKAIEALPSKRSVNTHTHKLHNFHSKFTLFAILQYKMIDKFVEDSKEIQEVLDALWMKYGCSAGLEEAMKEVDTKAFIGDFMDLLTDGLKALGGLFWVRKNLLEVKEQYECLICALQAIADSKALEKALQCVHSAVRGILGLEDGTCVKYSSVPAVLGATVVVDGHELAVRDIVLKRLSAADIAALRELYEACVYGLGCNPELLASRFCQIEYTFYRCVRDVQRMGDDGEKNALAQVCVNMNEMLKEARVYGFKSSDQEYDFGWLVNALSKATGKFGEDEFTKGISAEAVVLNTIDIVKTLSEGSMESSMPQGCICQ